MNVTCIGARPQIGTQTKKFIKKRGKTNMKNSIKKFVVACAAVAAVSVAASFSAMAYTDLGTVTYDETANSATITMPANVTGEATVLVLNAELTDGINDSNILYVNQETGGDFDKSGTDTEVLKLKGTSKLADGTYYVYVGYDNGSGFAIAEGKFTVGNVTPPTPDYTKGDVNNDGAINSTDAVAIINNFVDAATYPFTDTQKLAADVSGDGAINSTDAVGIINYYVNGAWN